MTGFGGSRSIVNHRRRISAFPVLNDRHAYTLRPNSQLIGGGSPEGISGGNHDGLTVFRIVFCKFTDSCRLTDTIYTDYKNDLRPFRILFRLIVFFQ